MFVYAIDALRDKAQLLEQNVREWERESDPHAINKPRADFAREKIVELEAAIEVLNGHERASPFAKATADGQKAQENHG